MRKIESIILQEKENLTIHEYAFINADQIIFSDEIRSICEKNTCRMYGKSWACPPAVGSIEDCKKKCSEFENAFVFTSLSNLKDMYDVDEWYKARIIHEKITDKVTQIFRAEFKKILILSAEGCTLCKTCSYPNGSCRFPDRMYPATEGFGIIVTQLAQTGNIKYNNGSNSLTYFSLIFF